MSTKRNNESRVINVNRKNKRKSITLETKCAIINSHLAGKPVKDMCAKYSLSASTVCTILKGKEQYLKGAKNDQSMQSTWCRKKVVDSIIPQMEKLLTEWIRDQSESLNMPVKYQTIRVKALSIFEMLKAEKGGACKETFYASAGWYDRYKKRAGMHKKNEVKNKGQEEAPTSAKIEEQKSFPKMLEEIIEEGEYIPSQIFNVDETGLFWKRMPSKTCIAREESSALGFKVSRDRVTLLLGGNVAGDCKLKPMLVHRSENIKALKGIVKATLPVIWKANKKTLVTTTLFEEWFSHHFVPEVKQYCEDKHIPFRAILILDDAPGHPPALQYHHPNVKIIFMPPITTSLLQPMDQGVTAMFKAFYLRETFEMITNEVDKENGQTLQEIWKKFDVIDAIKLIKQAWNKITEKNIISAWKKLCPQLIDNLEEFEEPENVIRDETEAIVKIAKRLRLKVSPIDVHEMLQGHSQELTNEDFIEMETREWEEDLATETPVCSFTLEGLNEAFQCIEKAIKIFQSQDSNFERSTNVSTDLENAFDCYRKIYKEKKRLSWTHTNQNSPNFEDPLHGLPNHTIFRPCQSASDQSPLNIKRE